MRKRLKILAVLLVLLLTAVAVPLFAQTGTCGGWIHSCFGDVCFVCDDNGGFFKTCDPVWGSAFCCCHTAWPAGCIEFGSCVYIP